MAIGWGSAGISETPECDVGSPGSFSGINSTGTDTCLVAVLAPHSGAGITGVTYQGVSMTLIGSIGQCHFYKLVNPASTTNGTLEISVDNYALVATCVRVIVEVDQTTPNGSAFTNQAEDASPTVTVTGDTTGKFIVGAIEWRSGENPQRTLSVSAPVEKTIEEVFSTYTASALLNRPGGSSVAIGGSLDGTAEWDMVAAAFNEAAGGPIEHSESGSITPTGTLQKKVITTKSGSITPSATLNAAVVIPLSVSGSITPTGSIAEIQVNLNSLKGTLTPEGSLVKKVIRSLAGSITPTSTLSSTSFTRYVSGSITPSGILQKKVIKTLSANITPVGEVGAYSGGYTPPANVSNAGASYYLRRRR